jgi:D-hexose-6-phosphate mutarotase
MADGDLQDLITHMEEATGNTAEKNGTLAAFSPYFRIGGLAKVGVETVLIRDVVDTTDCVVEYYNRTYQIPMDRLIPYIIGNFPVQASVPVESPKEL